MQHHSINIIATSEKRLEMESYLQGYFSNDKWDMLDMFFEKFRGQNFETTRRSRNIDYSIWNFNSNIKLELKFYFAKQLIDNNFSVTTALTTFQRTKQIKEFLKFNYPHIDSLMDIELDKAIIKLRTFLHNKGLKSGTKQKFDFEAVYDTRRIYKFLADFYDTRSEYEKDKWDVRKLPGVIFSHTSGHFTLSFKLVPTPFKAIVKQYLFARLKIRTFGTVLGDSNYIRDFLIYLHRKYPSWTGLTELTRNHLEDYCNHFAMIKGQTTEDYRCRVLSGLYSFLEYIQKAKYPEAPKEPAYYLLFKEDMPKRMRTKNRRIKYIPESILEQLTVLLNKEPNELNPIMAEKDKEYIPIIILLIETGFRISDVLNLKYDNCLIKTNNQWYLKGDIQKTQILDHTIPISEEVALMVQASIKYRQSKAENAEYNPNKYLFVRNYGSRMGYPPSPAAVANTLNRWARCYGILDDFGQVYHFRNHAFRHTRAVELINNGMSLLTLQKYMAHCSPEMTMVYAQITDGTMKKEWEQAQEARNPLLQINITTGEVREAETDVIEWERIRHNLEVARVPMGYCMASKNMGCPYVETPCLTCNNFCTTPDNLPEYENEIKVTEDLINRTRNMPIWNEKNEKRLIHLKMIRDTLVIGHIHHPAGKNRREFPG